MPNNYLADTKYDNMEIAQANPLIQASKCFSTIEGRLFYLAVMELKQHFPNSKRYDTEFSDIIIPAETVIRILGGNNRLYNDLVKIAQKLLKKIISIKIDNGDGEFAWIGYTIFSKMEFDTQGGGLKIRFNDDMKPYLLELHKTPFTNVNSRIVFSLQSGYAVRLMELMMKYKNAPYARQGNQIVWYYDLEELRILLQLREDQYKSAKDFRIRCIDTPINEINKATRYHMDYTIARKGRKIKGFSLVLTLPDDFDYQEKTMATVEETVAKAECKATAKMIKKVNEILPPEKVFSEPLSAEDELVDRLKVKGILKGTSRKWLKEFGYDKLAWVEKYVDEKAKKGTVQKYGAYYRSIIESNEYENALAENARIEAEREKRSQTIAIQMAQHKEEMERENIETNQIIENGFYSLSIDALQSFVRIYQNHLDKLAAEPEIDEEAIGRTLATLDKYKNRIREIQKKELEAEYGTDIQEEFSSQASAESQVSNTQQQMDFNALLNGLVNAKRVF